MTIKKFYTEKELAARWEISIKTLQAWRVSGKGPKYTKLGASVRYLVDEVEQFEADSMLSSTSEASA